jgi:hypothetical protein
MIKKVCFWGIPYKPGKDTTLLVENSIGILGAMDHPNAHLMNDTTYFIPNVGGSSLGYFQLFIYKNGTCKYVEQISNRLSKNRVDSIKSSKKKSEAKRVASCN